METDEFCDHWRIAVTCHVSVELLHALWLLYTVTLYDKGATMGKNDIWPSNFQQKMEEKHMESLLLNEYYTEHI